MALEAEKAGQGPTRQTTLPSLEGDAMGRQAVSAMPDQMYPPGYLNTGPESQPGRADRTFQEPKPPWGCSGLV